MSSRKMKALAMDPNEQSRAARERMCPDLTARSMSQKIDAVKRMIHVIALHDVTAIDVPNRWGVYVMARRDL